MNLVVRRCSCFMSHGIISFEWALRWRWSSSCAGLALQLILFMYTKKIVLLVMRLVVVILGALWHLYDDEIERADKKKRKRRKRKIKMKKNSHTPKIKLLLGFFLLFVLNGIPRWMKFHHLIMTLWQESVRIVTRKFICDSLCPSCLSWWDFAIDVVNPILEYDLVDVTLYDAYSPSLSGRLSRLKLFE